MGTTVESGSSVRRQAGAGLSVALAVLMLAACQVPFDFDGDAKADRTWVDDSEAWQQEGQAWPIWVPPAEEHRIAPGNYDGDATWEYGAVTASGDWVTAGTAGTIEFPFPETDHAHYILVPADYDGDHKTDPATGA